MASTNPALNERVLRQSIAAGASAEPMTVSGTATKAILLIALTIFSAGWVWTATTSNPAVVLPAVMVGAIGGLIVALVARFKPQTSPFTAPLYAVLEGLALGAISALYAASYHGIALEAVGLSCTVALGMLVAYQTGLIRATPMLRRIVVSAVIGIFLFYLLTIVLGMVGVSMPFLWDSSPLGIGLSVVFAGVAAFTFVFNFDMIERGAQYGAPKYMEWYGGFAILVSLVWLYLEILQLLARLRR